MPVKRPSTSPPAIKAKGRAAQPQLVEASSAGRALNILGDRWSLMVLHLAFLRVRRFEDFQNRIGLARSLLTNRLRRLERAGVLRREPYQDNPPREEYRLTKMGLDLFGPSLMIIRWEKRWFYDKRIPAHRLRHSCGHTLTPECRCKACGLIVDPHDTFAVDGPGAGGDPQQKPRAQRRSIVPRENLSPDERMLERSTEVLGDRWTAHVIASAFLGVRRFSDFQEALQVAPNILTDRLNRLVDLGVLTKRAYQMRPERFEYRLTATGQDLFPLILELIRWGDRWLAGSNGPPKIIRHRLCGKILVPKITCDHCGEVVDRRSTNIPPARR